MRQKSSFFFICNPRHNRTTLSVLRPLQPESNCTFCSKSHTNPPETPLPLSPHRTEKRAGEKGHDGLAVNLRNENKDWRQSVWETRTGSMGHSCSPNLSVITARFVLLFVFFDLEDTSLSPHQPSSSPYPSAHQTGSREAFHSLLSLFAPAFHGQDLCSHLGLQSKCVLDEDTVIAASLCVTADVRQDRF